jgi:hypothetical protein
MALEAQLEKAKPSERFLTWKLSEGSDWSGPTRSSMQTPARVGNTVTSNFVSSIPHDVSAPSDLMLALNRTITASRWNTYLTAAGYRKDVAAALYLWNSSVCQSFHFPLQSAEVALRNVVNQALVTAFGANWWRDPSSRVLLGTESRREIDKAVARIRDKYRTSPRTDQITCSLTFGFWSSILRGNMNQSLWDKHKAVAFPRLREKDTMRDVRSVTVEILELRNQIFHHEPLIGRDLLGDYGKILKLLSWICPHTRAWVRRHSTVHIAVRQRPR